MATESAPAGVDATTPNAARIYDFMLGGKDNFACDREVADKLIQLEPRVQKTMRENRRFLNAVVQYLVKEAGIRQFLDLGTGLPTQENVHQVAHRYAPDARVVYVDNDPVVLAHARALLRGENVKIVEGDLRRPAELLRQPAVRELLDFGEPVAVLLVAILHFLPDEADPYGLVGALKETMAPGSYLVLTHGTADGRTAEARDAAIKLYESVNSPLVLRTHAEMLPFFDGMDMVPPGLTWIQQWWPEMSVRSPELRGMYAGVGRKP